MATTDIDPCRATNDLENVKFAIDCNGNVVVRVADDCATAVLEQILIAVGGNAGTAFHQADSDVTMVAGNALTVLSSTVPALTTRNIAKVVVSSRAAGKFEIKVNSTVVGSGRLNAANLNAEYIFSPVFSASAGEVIEVDFTMLHGQTGQDVEVYLMATDMT